MYHLVILTVNISLHIFMFRLHVYYPTWYLGCPFRSRLPWAPMKGAPLWRAWHRRRWSGGRSRCCTKRRHERHENRERIWSSLILSTEYYKYKYIYIYIYLYIYIFIFIYININIYIYLYIFIYIYMYIYIYFSPETTHNCWFWHGFSQQATN